MVKIITVHGERPIHIHLCLGLSGQTGLDDPGEHHEWKCNSPYCNDRVRYCPEHNGVIPRYDL